MHNLAIFSFIFAYVYFSWSYYYSFGFLVYANINNFNQINELRIGSELSLRGAQ